MDYIFILVVVLLFFLGTTKVVELAELLRDVEQRRNLAYRVLGFLAMSAWIHALPSILLLIYMRENGILAPEVFTQDAPRATVVGLYLAPAVLLATFLLTQGAVFASMRNEKARFLSRDSTGGYVLFALFIGFVGYNEGWWVAIFLSIVSIVVSGYVAFSLLAPLQLQLRIFWTPFLAIAAVSASMFALSPAIERNVSAELRRFSIGGGKNAVITYQGRTMQGSLVLLTRETAYLQVRLQELAIASMDQKVRQQGCMLRVPVAEAMIATSDVLFSRLTASGEAEPKWPEAPCPIYRDPALEAEEESTKAAETKTPTPSLAPPGEKASDKAR